MEKKIDSIKISEFTAAINYVTKKEDCVSIFHSAVHFDTKTLPFIFLALSYE